MGKNLKLTPTMLSGLHKMAQKLKQQSDTMAEPNDNTGRALAVRGLVQFVEQRRGFNYYVLTDAGRAELARAQELGL